MVPGFVLMVYRYDPGCPCCQGKAAGDGWWFGGAAPEPDRAVYEMTFATDTTDSTTSGQLAVNRRRHATLGHRDEAAYSCGGDTSNHFSSNIIDGEKFSFSTRVSTVLTAARLTEKSSEFAAVSERETKGYFAGGVSIDMFQIGRFIDTAWKLTFSNDTAAAETSAKLSEARSQVVGLTEGTTKGYFCGGEVDLNGVWVKTVDKVTFSSDSTALSGSAELPEQRGRMNQSGISDGSTKGYLSGGISVFGGQPVDTVFKLTFSGDTTSNVTSASLSVRRNIFAGMSEGESKGYVSGGRTFGGGIDTEATDKISFSTDSVAAVTTASLPAARIFHTGCSAISL